MELETVRSLLRSQVEQKQSYQRHNDQLLRAS